MADDTCKVCQRLHGKDQPCPQRVANAYMMRPQAPEQLTDIDKAWMIKVKLVGKEINILKLLEHELADHMCEAVGFNSYERS